MLVLYWSKAVVCLNDKLFVLYGGLFSIYWVITHSHRLQFGCISSCDSFLYVLFFHPHWDGIFVQWKQNFLKMLTQVDKLAFFENDDARLVMWCILYDFCTNIHSVGCAVHVHTVSKDKYCFLQSSFYITAKMAENVIPVAVLHQNEENCILDHWMVIQCNLDIPAVR